MHFPEPRPKNDDERVLPLINVVFLLLIFFMLAGRLTVSDPFEVEPPRSESEGAVEGHDTLILIGADGRVAVNGEVVPRDELRAALERRLSGDEPGTVRVKADGQGDANGVVAIMEVLREAGVERLKLLTVPASG